jgi:hypothetical protein
MLSNISPASFNATAMIVLAPSSFTPSSAVRWVNALFFVSLVLSLAAALFGILAKQWLREYMQWNSSLGAPRENVLVRQIRIEAWEAWNVAATIASVPALLEFAMVLFLIGVVILLWTLDDVVAIVVTVFVSLFLSVISTFTILPIFARRCPYKSPTTWACVVASSYVSYPVRALLRWYPVLRARWNSNMQGNSKLPVLRRILSLFGSHWAQSWDDNVKVPVESLPSGLETWRQRDLDACMVKKIRISGWWPKYKDARAASKRELAQEDVNLSATGAFLWDPDAGSYEDSNADLLVRNISETAFLVRALSWVERASHQSRIHTYVEQCLPTIHTDESARKDNIRAVTLWCLISSLRRNDFTHPHLALREMYGLGNDPQACTTITALRKELAVTWDSDSCQFPTLECTSFLLPRRASPWGSILCRMLPSAIEATIMSSSWRSGSPVSVRRVLEWMKLWEDNTVGVSVTDWHLGILQSILSSDNQAQIHNLAPDIRSLALQIAFSRAKVTMDDEGKNLGKMPYPLVSHPVLIAVSSTWSTPSFSHYSGKNKLRRLCSRAHELFPFGVGFRGSGYLHPGLPRMALSFIRP